MSLHINYDYNLYPVLESLNDAMMVLLYVLHLTIVCLTHDTLP